MSQPQLHHVAGQLSAALDKASYGKRAWLAYPGGFALVTQMEQIADDGTPLPPPDRWALEPQRSFSLTGLMSTLSKGVRPGRFRIIVFLVTDRTVVTSPETASREEALAWLEYSALSLPPHIAKAPLTENHTCQVLIYEFLKEGRDRPAVFRENSNIRVADHLTKSGLPLAL